MKISILTMFPQMLSGLFESPVVQRAIRQKLVEIEIIDIKDFADGSFRHIDDSPYGGDLGMIMRIEPLTASLESVRKHNSHTVLLSPKGKVFDQTKAKSFAKLEHLILVCGHYEGTDARFDSYADEQISLGDFVLTGGEPAATCVCDSVIRLIDGTLKDGVTENESHENNLLEYPQYTHPLTFKGVTVPEILLSGDTKRIKEWKHKMSIYETKKYRPDMAFEYMKDKIKQAEESLCCLFSERTTVSEKIAKYSDSALPDMYDHNFFSLDTVISQDDFDNLLKIRTEENADFIKIQSSVRLDATLVKDNGLEEYATLTMALFDPSQAEFWTENSNLPLRTYHKDRNSKDLFEIELKNYEAVYGTDFTTRKLSRFLKASDKDKRLDFLSAYKDGKIVSYLCTWTDSDCVGIDDLITTTEFRHQKAATTLLKHACNLAPFAYLHADEDDTPKEMYKKLGFTEVAKTWEYFKKLK